MSLSRNSLTFREYHSCVGGEKADAWSDYLLYGGMPELVSLQGDAAKKSYLDGLFTTIYFRDIVERNNVEPDHLMECAISYVSLMDFLMKPEIIE